MSTVSIDGDYLATGVDFVIAAGDQLPVFTATLKDEEGVVVPLTGSPPPTVTLTLRQVGRPTPLLEATMEILGDGSTGRVRHQWSPRDTATPGRYFGHITVRYPDETSERFPPTKYFTVLVTP
jgi:hypothetical protein